MSLVTIEQVQAALANNKVVKDAWGYAIDDGAPLRRAIGHAMGAHYAKIDSGEIKITEEDIKKWLDRELDNALGHRLGKGVRPWHVVNVVEKLDPNQAWIGIEYETGFDTNKDYQRVINYVWHNFNNSCIDSEGGSNYPCELTFSPINYDDFVSGNGPMDKLYAFMAENNIVVPSEWGYNCDHDDPDDCYCDDDEPPVGTHSNISTPAYRNITGRGINGVEEIFNCSLQMLSERSVKSLFGRIPYGGFGARQSRDNCWMEGKLFKSTGDVNQWNNYKQVIARLAQAQEQVSQVFLDDPLKKVSHSGRNLIITNFHKFLSGEDEEVTLGYRTLQEAKWSRDHWW